MRKPLIKLKRNSRMTKKSCLASSTIKSHRKNQERFLVTTEYSLRKYANLTGNKTGCWCLPISILENQCQSILDECSTKFYQAYRRKIWRLSTGLKRWSAMMAPSHLTRSFQLWSSLFTSQTTRKVPLIREEKAISWARKEEQWHRQWWSHRLLTWKLWVKSSNKFNKQWESLRQVIKSMWDKDRWWRTKKKILKFIQTKTASLRMLSKWCNSL